MAILHCNDPPPMPILYDTAKQHIDLLPTCYFDVPMNISIKYTSRVGRFLSSGTRPPPPPPSRPSGPTELPRVNSYWPYIWCPNFFFISLAHVAPLPAQVLEHPNTILEPNLDSNAPQPSGGPSACS